MSIKDCYNIEDFKKLAFLKNELNISIAAGENACTHWQFEQMIDENAVNFTQPSVIKVRGISEMSKIIKYSENNYIPVMPHTSYFGPGFLSSLQLASSTKLEVVIERFLLNLKEEFYPDWETTRNGKYLLPSGPGLGLGFKEKIISKYSV